VRIGRTCLFNAFWDRDRLIYLLGTDFTCDVDEGVEQCPHLRCFVGCEKDGLAKVSSTENSTLIKSNTRMEERRTVRQGTTT
jgi:hypothetical protein